MTARGNSGDDDRTGEASVSEADQGQKRRRRRRNRNSPPDAPRHDARPPARSRDRGAERGPRRPAPPTQAPNIQSKSGSDHDRRLDHAPSEATESSETTEASETTESSDRWGDDDNAAPSPCELGAEFPPDPPETDPDPVTFDLADGPSAPLGNDVASLVGIRFVPAGRVSWFAADDVHYLPGERVLVDSDRGPRLAWIATATSRKPVPERGLRRVLRRATDRDLSSERAGDAHQAHALRTAKDAAAALRLPLKVFRVEVGGGKLVVYYTTDERLDLRDFTRNVSQSIGLRIELRQIGGRDEAKLVGGIGSCGLPLCCSTFLPEFVPVSIKMAKDQGLVLSPSRVSGQCGRLKCCLVYEQEAYAELRKGLPKLGKRVISARGEGRVVEVDVLTQRVRVSYAPGDTELLPASEVKPRFPSGAQPGSTDHSVHADDDSTDLT